jgi:hypothetical protein
MDHFKKLKDFLHHRVEAKKYSRSEAAIILYILLCFDYETNTVDITYHDVADVVAIKLIGFHSALRQLATRGIIEQVDGDCYRVNWF